MAEAANPHHPSLNPPRMHNGLITFAMGRANQRAARLRARVAEAANPNHPSLNPVANFNAGTIGPALGLSPMVYGQAGPWDVPLGMKPYLGGYSQNPRNCERNCLRDAGCQQHIDPFSGTEKWKCPDAISSEKAQACIRGCVTARPPAPQPSARPGMLATVPRAGSPMGAHAGRAASLRSLNPPTAIDFRGPQPGAAWWPTMGYGTGQFGRQYSPNRQPFPGLPTNAPYVPPNMLVGPTDTIVVGARRPQIPPADDDNVSVGGKAARLARNIWGSVASCSGSKKTCGKSLDFRDPATMGNHAYGQPKGAPPQPNVASNNYRIHPDYMRSRGWWTMPSAHVDPRFFFNQRWALAGGAR